MLTLLDKCNYHGKSFLVWVKKKYWSYFHESICIHLALLHPTAVKKKNIPTAKQIGDSLSDLGRSTQSGSICNRLFSRTTLNENWAKEGTRILETHLQTWGQTLINSDDDVTCKVAASVNSLYCVCLFCNFWQPAKAAQMEAHVSDFDTGSWT